PRPPGPPRRAGHAARPRRLVVLRPADPVGPPGRGHRPHPGRTVRGGGDGHGVREVAVLPAARGRGGDGPRPWHGDLHLPDQGAGPGPAPDDHERPRAPPGGRHVRRRPPAPTPHPAPPPPQPPAHPPPPP